MNLTLFCKRDYVGAIEIHYYPGRDVPAHSGIDLRLDVLDLLTNPLQYLFFYIGTGQKILQTLTVSFEYVLSIRIRVGLVLALGNIQCAEVDPPGDRLQSVYVVFN